MPPAPVALQAVAGMSRRSSGGRGAPGHFRLRHDIADKKGAITLRGGGRLYHLRIGAALARRRVLPIVDVTEVTVVALDTGEILSNHLIEPAKGYWRKHATRPRPLAEVPDDRRITVTRMSRLT